MYSRLMGRLEMERGICPIAAVYVAFNVLSHSKQLLVHKSTNCTTALYCNCFRSQSWCHWSGDRVSWWISIDGPL